MTALFARYPVLADTRVLAVIAVVAALASSVLVGAWNASAGMVIHSGPRGG